MEEIKLFIVKSTYLDGRIVFTITDEPEQLCFWLPWSEVLNREKIISGKYPSGTKDIIKNYWNIFINQPEIKKLKISNESAWYFYDERVVKQVLNSKLIYNMILDYKESKDWKELLYRKLIAEIEQIGGDESGSLLLEEFENKLGDIYKFYIMKDKILEIDWRNLYDNCWGINHLCESYKVFLDLVEKIFGFINVEILPGGKVREYIPKTDLYASTEIIKLKNILDELGGYFETKMKSICDLLLDNLCPITMDDLMWIQNRFKEPLLLLGAERIKALGYKEKDLKEEIENLKKEKIIGEDLIEIFKVGNKYPAWYISEILKQVFKDRFYNKRPTASFIKRFFYVSRCKSKTRDGRECLGYKIIKIK